VKYKRTISIGLVLVMVIALLSGCASKPAAEEPSAQAPQVEQTTEHPEKNVKLYIGRGETEPSYRIWRELSDRYKVEVNPNFTVEFESVPNHDQWSSKLRLYIAGDDLPDIFQMDNGPISEELAAQGKLVNLGEELKNMGMLDKYNPGALAYVTHEDGSVFLIPDARYGEAFFYWTETFDKYGLEEPTTWSEFKEVCQILKDNGEVPLAISGKSTWNMLRMIAFVPWRVTYDGYISRLKTGSIKMADEQVGVDAVNLLHELGTSGYFQPGFSNIDYTDTVNSFVGGQAVMLYGYSAYANQLTEAYEEGKIGYFLIPDAEGYENMETNMVIHAGKAWGFNADTFDDEMRNFLQFVVNNYNDTCYKYGVHSPLDLGVPDGQSKIMSDLYEDMAKQTVCWVGWDTKLDPATSVLVANLSVQLAMGMITPEEFMDEIDASIAKNAPAYFG